MIGRLSAYVPQRFPVRVFFPVLGLLTALACWTTAVSLGSAEAGRAALLMTGIVVLLRVWDDIEDRDHDRVAHPDRVLPQGPVGGFVAMAVVIATGLAGVLLWSGSMDAAMGLTALMVAACLGYRVLRPSLPPAAWPYFLLLKYPAMVTTVALASGAPRPGRLLFSVLLTYGGAYAYEGLHDRVRRPHSPGATP